MAFGVKTNERPGTRCEVRYVRMSASKARVVLDLIRGKTIREAAEILAFTERSAAEVLAKALNSAVSNAINNDGQAAEELYVSACFADEGPTLKRWRPRARGRATRIRKRTCHITLIVSRLSEERLTVRRNAEAAKAISRGGRGRTARDQNESGVERSSDFDDRLAVMVAAPEDDRLHVERDDPGMGRSLGDVAGGGRGPCRGIVPHPDRREPSVGGDRDGGGRVDVEDRSRSQRDQSLVQGVRYGVRHEVRVTAR